MNQTIKNKNNNTYFLWLHINHTQNKIDLDNTTV